MRHCFLIISFCFCINSVIAQTVEGRIFDATNNEPLPGALIINQKDSSGAVSGKNGVFQLEIAGYPVSLAISSIGYNLEVSFVNDTSGFLNIGMSPASQHLNEVVVSATRFNNKIIDIPASVHLINEQQLQRNDETIIMPVINRMPGIFMESGSLNTNRLSIRGIGSRTPYGTNRVRAYFNEIPLTSGEGESTIEDIDINALERVEIIKGPASSIYGSGLGGAINLISASPEYLQSTIAAKTIFGSYGLRNYQLSLVHGMDNGSLYIGLNNVYSKGFRENSKFFRKSATIGSTIYSNENFSFSFLGSFINLKSFIPSSIGQTTFRDDPSAAATNWKEAKGFEAYIKSIAGFSTEYNFTPAFKNYSSIFLSFRDADEPRPFDILLENTVSAGFRTRFTYETLLNDNPLILQIGGEVFSDRFQWSTYENLYEQFPGQGSISGSILSDKKEKRQYYNLFAQFSWEISDKFSMESGLNYNNTRYQLTDLFHEDDIDETGDYHFDPVFSPRIGLVYKMKEGWNSFFTISHGYSMPSLAETLTPEGQLNTDIKPETGINLEIGTKGRWLNDRLFGEVSIYRMYIDNLLVAERTGFDQYVGVNAGKTLHDGVEVMLNYNFAVGNAFSLQPFISFTATNYRFEKYNHRDIDYSGKTISGFPDKLLNVGFDFKLENGFYMFGDYRYVGKAALNDENSSFNESYSVINIKTGFLFQLGEAWQLDVSGGINNLADEKYASMVLVNDVPSGNAEPRYFYPGLPRNFYGGIKLSYQF